MNRWDVVCPVWFVILISGLLRTGCTNVPQWSDLFPTEGYLSSSHSWYQHQEIYFVFHSGGSFFLPSDWDATQSTHGIDQMTLKWSISIRGSLFQFHPFDHQIDRFFSCFKISISTLWCQPSIRILFLWCFSTSILSSSVRALGSQAWWVCGNILWSASSGKGFYKATAV